MPCYHFEGLTPVIAPGAYVHPSAVLIGDVIIGPGVYIAPFACLRGDFGRIVLEEGSNLQDHCMIHGAPEQTTLVRTNGHIGHGAILHGCTIGADSLVGMAAVVMDGAEIGPESMVGAMSFVKKRFQGERRQLLLGTPARVVRLLTDQELEGKRRGTAEYQALARRYALDLQEVAPLAACEPGRPTLRGFVTG